MKILVTGCCGFIGSNFVRYMLNKYPDYELYNLDALTYAGNLDNLKGVDSGRYHFVHGSIWDEAAVTELLKNVDGVINFAAESHVDRSIENSRPFLDTNVIGLQVLLDAALKAKVQRFVHVSTDEVYGSLETGDGKFTETTPFDPNSPYAASKAAGDLLIKAFYKTFGFPVITVRPSNNYGPYQYPEKFIPLMITNLLTGKPVPVYGQGTNVRDWLYVGDNCKAIDLVFHKGREGQSYNIGGDSERKNLEILHKVMEIMNESGAAKITGEAAFKYVKDRPGHDFRYALDNAKITAELGWRPEKKIEDGLVDTINWYIDNEWWWQSLKKRLAAESEGFWK
ncbi:dTDP-glucose 4,6-dehydratase [Candidatus Magnetominusculus xianensis]|uniref:dTDP-glucose 4,6-dehydratase n=1 Tax=Candidatus Magnetominusculus xianensis TaxID=1748249 RepID=A0ABR5SFG2_9BACT|nr:dTDP-glucose 4,6-dehydratase [Candidatus Magnetominusculus xianensis]KWT78204.1 dTDP-glucose 4,6-dehydratase [Candidatus Magnetominusculus xianensis]MBF0402844.1 dTDP-glucose 4,6-dehydratase [Nitrospirota bacterium]